MITIVPVAERTEDMKDENGIYYIDNSVANSMAAKYNWAIENIIIPSNEDVICFRHADADVRTKPEICERKVRELFKKNIGICGLIGTIMMDRNCIWWAGSVIHGGRGTCGVGAIIQGSVNDKGEPIEYWMKDHPGTHDYAATVDGCCFWINRKLFDEGLRFDESLADYHFYDADICLQILERGYKVSTIDIVVKHTSQGRLPSNFNSLKEVFFEKWNKKVGGVWPISRLTKFVE